MKAIYWTNVTVNNAQFAFPVRVLPSDDERLEKRRASIAARRKAKSMSAGVTSGKTHVVSVERIEPNDTRL